MEEFVTQLKGQSRASAAASSSAIFGSVGSLAGALQLDGARLKIGLWPVQSRAAPEAAMGLVVLLGLLLEHWPGVRVYRLVAQIEGEPEQYQWDIERSQFGIDDWELDGLDENVAIWGTLDKSGGGWQLTLEIENDLAEAGEDRDTLRHTGDSLTELVSWLPEAAREIAAHLDAGEPSLPLYSSVTVNDSRLKLLLEQLFHWERKLYLSLWGVGWSDEQISADAKAILTSVPENDFGAWLVGRTIGRGLNPLFAPVGEALVSLVPEIVNTFDMSDLPAVFLAGPLHGLEYPTEAYDLLETNLVNHPDSLVSWLTLAGLYLSGGELPAALDTYQRAIEAETVSVELFTRYADLLLLLDSQGIAYGVGARQHTVAGRSFVEGFVLIDPEETESDWLRWEAAEAYQSALELAPDNSDLLYQLLLLMIDLDAGQIWEDFELLVTSDTEGDRVRSLVDALNGLDDITPAVDVLRKAVQAHPDRLNLRLSLAALYLLDDQPDTAERELDAAADISDDVQILGDIDRLRLSVDDPEFEARFGEISDRVNAGHSLNAADVQYLETALDKAPNFSTAYTLLASAYLAWEEKDDALEVLLDGQRRFPTQPDILALLGRVLWDSGEKELALDYLTKGLTANPNHIPLLVTTGRYLFDSGQDVEARLFLMRAEALDPQHPMLSAVRAHIARVLSSE